MRTRKVDLVRYVGGERRVVGEAVVDLDPSGRYFDISATVTDARYQEMFTDGILDHISVHTNNETKNRPIVITSED